ncbi:hypothetical protein [Pseudanabaena sp. FACHB-1998]|nr:hypothetical protein [Pseudanabaena sp. FACHB-1998]
MISRRSLNQYFPLRSPLPLTKAIANSTPDSEIIFHVTPVTY